MQGSVDRVGEVGGEREEAKTYSFSGCDGNFLASKWHCVLRERDESQFIKHLSLCERVFWLLYRTKNRYCVSHVAAIS